ncbi:HNH endonuclease [Francisella philomiragia]|uniref:HNH endonuclease n=2 Tax=Francisella philomiragia TaxID=28110 RepID=A0ABS1GAA7_9GAMM|nr:HNH endonuclease signature motif containing protein [Francisella philomiragia]MBK2258021.1 HNH endonuclease [Francisella philomiragia]MBK2267220.1 HNH endonuclease [Francisella philomiragia]MBK2278767.1 HNH endonuclease [Francisella philomiragia]MBK2286621.1 HNH endonuclease [Francisella philomiragia]MBK2288505.1 HNH endonuclease [Francisella philomiragia]
MKNKIRKNTPIRTCKKQYKRYNSYKTFLINDFNNRCGYCDTHDKYLGGKKNFQIDHFRPHSIESFVTLKNKYSNLVYSCQSCNRAKSNKWKDLNGFIDPCSIEYDNILFRDSEGRIYHNGTDQGEYIYYNLNLYIKRHELIWCIEKIESQKEEINSLIDSNKYQSDSIEFELLKKFRSIQKELDKYNSLFYKEIS